MKPEIFVYNKTGIKYLVMHRGVINTSYLAAQEGMVLYTVLETDSTSRPWYVMSNSEFDSEFTAAE